MEKEEKNMIKILSYMTKINKNQNEMNLLFQTSMKNLKITFEEDKSNIKYEEYIFNGIPIPKNIEFKDIDINSFKIFWKIEEKFDKLIDKNNIKFKVEMRKENEKFEKVYENKDNNCTIGNLSSNTNYEIRICPIYNNVNVEWSEIMKVKTSTFNLDSVILENSKRKEEFLKKILEWSGYNKMELIYRGTRDGSTSNDFHNKCDNQGPTICLYQNEKNNIFGGFSPISWENNGSWKKCEESFIFTLTNIYGIEPTKFPHLNNKNSVNHNSSQGPSFYDFIIYDDFRNKDSKAYFPSGHQDIFNKKYSIITGDENSNNQSFKIKEIEVFKVYK